MNGPYDNMLHLPRHVSTGHPQMSIANRAAQFTPFGALTGYDAAIKETARLTDTRIELAESAIDKLDLKLSLLSARVEDHPEVIVTYYQPDAKKEGGAYMTVTGEIKKIDDYERQIVLRSGPRIPIEDLLDVDCALFANLL